MFPQCTSQAAPRPELASLPLTRMDQTPEEMTESRQLNQEGLRAVIQTPGSTQLIGGQVSRGGRAPASHTCPGPSKTLTFPRLPWATSPGEFTVTGYKQPEKWPRKEALSPAPAPGHAQRGHPRCSSPQGRTAGHLGEAVRTLLTRL